MGTARSALFNWFIARQDPQGIFILRIEDTDTERNREEWVGGIVAAMEWLGTSANIGPVRQSDNEPLHAEAVAALARAATSTSATAPVRTSRARKPPSSPPGYDGFCRDRHLSQGPTTAYRFRTPESGVTVVHDEIRGDVEFANDLIDDFVLARSSGAVLFALANVVDDRHDAITHVIRGEEHLPNTPKQIMLWNALNEATGHHLDLPTYAHLPVLVNEQRKKLSKRRDPVAVERYRDQGYLPEAFVNYLALLGWSPRQADEKVPLATCVEQFRLADVSHSPAFFDVKKLTHLNGEYIRELSHEEFIRRCAPWVAPLEGSWRPSDAAPRWRPDQFDASRFAAIAPVVQERVATLGDVAEMVDFLFLEEPHFDESAFDKTIRHDDAAREVLRRAIDEFATTTWSSEALHAATVAIGDAMGLPLRKTQAPIRCAVTGRTVGPPLFESLEILGRDVTRARLEGALSKVQG